MGLEDLAGDTYADAVNRINSTLKQLMEGAGSKAREAGQYLPPKVNEGPYVVDWTPPVDMYEQDDHLIVQANLPGVRKEDVSELFNCCSIVGCRSPTLNVD
jgi:HSP20 family molecular chaperone IbpA